MAEYPISIEDLNGKLEDLVEIILKNGIFNITAEEIAQLESPAIHKQRNGLQLTFKDRWSARMTRFSDENIQKIDILYNTRCRPLILHHIRSLYGFTLAEELLMVKPGLTKDEITRKRKYKYQQDPAKCAKGIRERRRRRKGNLPVECRIREPEPLPLPQNVPEESPDDSDEEEYSESSSSSEDSESEFSLSESVETDSSEDEVETVDTEDTRSEDAVPNCVGHSYDRFGVLKLHYRKLSCKESTIKNALKARKTFVQCNSWQEMLDGLNQTQERLASDREYLMSNYQDLRQEVVRNAKLETEIWHIKLDSDFAEWSDLQNLKEKVKGLLESDQLLAGYRFYLRHCTKNTDLSCLRMAFQCANAQRLRCQSSVKFRTSRTTVPLDCGGYLYVRVYLKPKLLVIKHAHRHHIDTSKEPVTPEMVFKIRSLLSRLSEEAGFFKLTGSEIVSEVRARGADAPSSAITNQYEYLVKRKYYSSDSDWISAQNYYLRFPLVAASFVVRSKEHTGQVVLFPQIIRGLSGKIESLAVDSTYGIGNHKCDVFFAIATLDRTGILVGYMVIKKSQKIAIEINKACKKGTVQPVSADAPLPQCETAQRVDMISGLRFPKESKTALLSSFFLLLKGTDRVTYVDNRGVCRQLAHGQEDVVPNPGHNTARDGNDTTGLAQNPYSGLVVPVITTDKDSSEINAASFVFPDTPISLCLWHTEQAVGRDLTERSARTPIIKWLRETVFPPYFAAVCPRLFDKTECQPCSCSQNVNPVNDTYSCWKCSPDDYSNWEEELVCKNDSKKAQCNLTDLLDLLRSHARAISFLPQMFPHLEHFSDVGRDAVLMEAEVLHRHILLEMLEFCLSKRILHVFQYLWDQWYCDAWFLKWTQCYWTTYNYFVTNTISEPFSGFIKRFLGPKRATIRLDELAFQILKEIYPKHLEKMETLIGCVEGTKDRCLEEDEIRISWVERRWSTLEALFENVVEEEATPEQYHQDRMEFGTNALDFVCGCKPYRVDNIHVCTHIMRCIHPDSYAGGRRRGLKFNLRPKPSPPFFISSNGLPVEAVGGSQVWLGLAFRSNYLVYCSTTHLQPTQHSIEAIRAVANPGPPNNTVLASGGDLASRLDTILLPAAREDSGFEFYEKWLSLFFVPAAALAYENISYHLPSFMSKADKRTLEFRHEFAVETLKIEVERLTEGTTPSTVSSGKRISSFKAAIYKLPVEVRGKLLVRANEYNLFTDPSLNKNVRSMSELWTKYFRLVSNSSA